MPTASPFVAKKRYGQYKVDSRNTLYFINFIMAAKIKFIFTFFHISFPYYNYIYILFSNKVRFLVNNTLISCIQKYEFLLDPIHIYPIDLDIAREISLVNVASLSYIKFYCQEIFLRCVLYYIFL